MHYYKRNIGDYAKKAGRLSMLQHGSYTLLIDSCYDREQFPTLEEAIEWTWASTTEEIEAVTFVLRKFFTLEDGVYVQKRIQEEIAEYHDKATTNKRIAEEREQKRRDALTLGAEKSTHRARVVNEAPPNHEPLTINQEPCLKPTADAVGKKQRRSELPDGFEPNEAGLQAADGLVVATEMAAFRNHHAAKGTLMVDWQAAWRTWVGNARKFARTAPTSFAQEKADVARVTVPGRQGVDPEILRAEEASRNACPPSAETLARIAQIQQGVAA